MIKLIRFMVIKIVVLAVLIAGLPVLADYTIFVGSEAIDRSAQAGSNLSTTISRAGTTAGSGGVITKVEVYANNSVPQFHVGIFYNTGGLNFTCRSAVDIGALTAGYHVFTGLELAVETGDYIGFYIYTGRLEAGYGEPLSVKIAGNKCSPGASGTYTEMAWEIISLKGSGAALPPQAPTGLEAIDLGGKSVELGWIPGDYTDNTRIQMQRGEYPPTINDGEQVYFGSGDNVIISGFSLMTTTYYFRAWGESGGEYSGDYAEDYIGGEEVEVDIGTLEIGGMLGIISLLLGLALIFINFFVKKGILYLAVIPCMVGCLVEPEFQNAWFQSGCVLIMIFAALAFFKSMSKGEQG